MSHLPQILTSLTLILVIAGCASNSATAPSAEAETASIEGPINFVSINGVTPDEESKRHAIPAGENEIIILYRSYVQQFECTYVFDAVAGARYEFVTRANPDPITLYRLERDNWLVWKRRDPLAPRDCKPVSR